MDSSRLTRLNRLLMKKQRLGIMRLDHKEVVDLNELLEELLMGSTPDAQTPEDRKFASGVQMRLRQPG